MPRPSGLPKTGGRKKGTPNRRTGILAEELDHLDFHPAEHLVKLIPTLEPESQARALIELMGFLYPKRKAMEQRIEVQSQPEPENQRDDGERTARIAYNMRRLGPLCDDSKVTEAYETLARHYEEEENLLKPANA
jgi:hypothetical protein